MNSYSIITYKGKEIVYADYRKTQSEQEMIDILEATNLFIMDENIPRLVLTNITGVFVLPDFLKKAKELGKQTKHLTVKTAIVGITGPKKTLLRFYNLFTDMDMKPFDTEEEAKEYLVND
jgi:predicted ABC-type exoprotein transport system permease subunit